jgi:hypothetical protein
VGFSGGADARTAPFNPVVGLFCTVPTKTTHGRNPGKIIFRIPVNRGTGKLSRTVEQGFFGRKFEIFWTKMSVLKVAEHKINFSRNWSFVLKMDGPSRQRFRRRKAKLRPRQVSVYAPERANYYCNFFHNAVEIYSFLS